jgi:hypothetical protein
MSTEIRIKADEARRLKSDTAFLEFMGAVRESQVQAFLSTAAGDTVAREEAHAIIRALNMIEGELDAAIAAQSLMDRKQRK